MPSPAPSPIAPAPPEVDRAHWQQFHRITMARMSALAGALDRQDWTEVHQACQWVQEALWRHQQEEERTLFPLLDRAGAPKLRHQLSADHRKIWKLNQRLLQAGREGRVEDPGSHGQRARRLLNLVREHIDAEEHLPLFQASPGHTAGASECPECAPPETCFESSPGQPATATPG